MLHEFTTSQDGIITVNLHHVETVEQCPFGQAKIITKSGTHTNVKESYETVVNAWAQAVEGGS